MTRLGSYLAVPLVYSSYYNQGALDEAKTFQTQRRTDLENYEKEKEAYHAALVEAETNPGEEGQPKPEPPQEPEKKELVLTGTSVKMVLCMDTLGRNEALPAEKIPELLDLCAKAAESKNE